MQRGEGKAFYNGFDRCGTFRSLAKFAAMGWASSRVF
jgi:hypothetical protein